MLCRSETVANCVIYWRIFCLGIGLDFGLGIWPSKLQRFKQFGVGPDLGSNLFAKVTRPLTKLHNKH